MEANSTTWAETEGVAYLPAPDTLWRHAPTPFSTLYSVLGVPLRVATNAPLLAEMAAEVFGGEATTSETREVPEKPFHIFLHPVSEALTFDKSPSVVMRMQGSYLFLTVGNSFGFADGVAGVATAYITPALVQERRFVQVSLLECLGVYLASQERPVTLHAAALAHQGRCVLLTGGSGAGKSTLAYACLRAGFQLLAEDVVFGVECSHGLNVWGNFRNLHLLPDAVRLFPELATMPTIQQLNGETKFRIPVPNYRPGAALAQATIWGVCSLQRTAARESRLQPADHDALRITLTDFKGDPPLRWDAIHSATQRLLAGRTAHLEVGTDLEQAVTTLRQWIETDGAMSL